MRITIIRDIDIGLVENGVDDLHVEIDLYAAFHVGRRCHCGMRSATTT